MMEEEKEPFSVYKEDTLFYVAGHALEAVYHDLRGYLSFETRGYFSDGNVFNKEVFRFAFKSGSIPNKVSEYLTNQIKRHIHHNLKSRKDESRIVMFGEDILIKLPSFSGIISKIDVEGDILYEIVEPTIGGTLNEFAELMKLQYPNQMVYTMIVESFPEAYIGLVTDWTR